MTAELARCNAARCNEMAGRKIIRNLGLELVGRVAMTEGDDDRVTREQIRGPATRELKPLVLAEPVDSSQEEIPRHRYGVVHDFEILGEDPPGC